MVFSYLLLREGSFRQFEDQAGFSLVHAWFEAAFVEWSTQRIESIGAAISSHRHETCSAEEGSDGNANADGEC